MYSLINDYKKHRKLKGAFKYARSTASKAAFNLRQAIKLYKFEKTKENLQKVKALKIKSRFLDAAKNAKLARLLSHSNLFKFYKYTIPKKFSIALECFIKKEVVQKKFFIGNLLFMKRVYQQLQKKNVELMNNLLVFV